MNILRKFSTQMNLNKNSKNYNITVIVFLSILLIIGIFMSTSIGSAEIPLSDIVSSMKQGDNTVKAYIIIMFVRIPRTLAAILAGSALSVSGAMLQSVLNNSLASPNIIGVNSGAGLFAVLIAAFFSENLHLTTVAAFTGAILAVFLVYFIAQKTGASRMAIVLSGVAVSSFIGAITDSVLTLKPDTAIARTAFLIGGFSGLLIVLAFFTSFLRSYDMNILALGDESAKSLGLNIVKVRFVCLILAAVLAGSAVSFAGQIEIISRLLRQQGEDLHL